MGNEVFMPTKLRFLGLLLVATVAMFAQRAFTVAEVVLFVKTRIKAKGDDRATGDYLHKIKLTQRLDDRTVEDLQGQGAGPRTVAALKELAVASAALPAAPAPAAVAAPPPPPKPPSAKEQAEILDEMREYALNYTNTLPNYMCVQTTHRKQEVTEMMHQKGYINNGDTIQELLTFYDHMETYKVEMVNGKSVTNVSHLQLGGVTSSGEFGSMMHDIFDQDAGTNLRGKIGTPFAASAWCTRSRITSTKITDMAWRISNRIAPTRPPIRDWFTGIGKPRRSPNHQGHHRNSAGFSNPRSAHHAGLRSY